MSLNELILDIFKPWLDARVNNLTVDGDLNVEGNVNFDQDSLVTNQILAGTFYSGPAFTISSKYNKVGNIITCKIEPFTISSSNQSANGTIVLISESDNTAFRPLADVNCVVPYVSVDGDLQFCNVEIETSGNMILYNGVVPNWIAGGDLISTREFVMTWTI